MSNHTKSSGSKAIVVLGSQWGDEGKGKIVDLLCQTADVVCRFQGGNNAGHTVVANGIMYDFHLLPSGLLNDKCINIMGNGMVIHLPGLFDELQANENKGLTNWQDRLIISSRAHLVFDFHQSVDGLEEQGKGKDMIGTTKKGIGPTYACKAARSGVRVADLVYDFNVFTLKFTQLAESYMKRYPQLVVDVAQELERYKAFQLRLKPMVKDTVSLMNELISQPGKSIIIEGANATMLDIDFGTYPMVTSSNCSVGGIFTGLGIPVRAIGPVYGVAKAYCTRVGSGEFPTEMDTETDEMVRKRGNEYGVTTKRARRCGWFDVVMMRYVHMINGFSALAITKLDILDTFEEIKVGVTYTINQKPINYFPATQEELSKVKVEYVSVPGWKQDTSQVRKFNDLPAPAQHYITKLEQLTSIPIKWVGVGSSRDAVIYRDVKERI